MFGFSSAATMDDSASKPRINAVCAVRSFIVTFQVLSESKFLFFKLEEIRQQTAFCAKPELSILQNDDTYLIDSGARREI